MRHTRITTVEDLISAVHRREQLYRQHEYDNRLVYRALTHGSIANMKLKDILPELSAGIYTRKSHKMGKRKYAFVVQAIASEDIAKVIKVVCIRYMVFLKELRSLRGTHYVGKVRMIVWYIMNQRYGITKAQCGRDYSNRDPGNVNKSIERFDSWMDENPKFHQEMVDLVLFINSHKSLTNP